VAVEQHAIKLTQWAEGVSVLEFTSGRRANAMHIALVTDLLETVRKLNDDTSLRVLVIRGGAGVFSGGADLGPFLEMDEQQYRHYIETEFALFDAIEGLPFLTIAAMEGPCLGNAAEMALACDYRIAASTARFGLAETRVGFQGPADRITKYVGIGVAKKLLYAGLIITAAESEAMGIVSEVVAPDALDARLREFAAECAALPAVAIRATKRNLARAYATTREMIEGEIAASLECYRTTDFREGVTAFFEKRPARFQGR
jgi:enoyl-CoA hydratase/carnithine racemase